MKTNKKGAIAVVVMGGIFLVATLVLVILGFTLDVVEDTHITLLVIAGMCGFLGLFCLFFGLYQLSVAKKKEAFIADTSSLAYKTYGNGGNYVRFMAYLNKADSDAEQANKTVAKNVIGAISLVTLGVGVFGSAGSNVPVVDVFVSPEEIILKSQSNDLSDAAFYRYPIAGIVNIMYASDTKHEKVYVVLQGGRFTLDIPVKTPNDRAYVRSIFDKIRTVVTAPVQQVTESQEESVQQAPVNSDDVFNI